MRLEVPHGGGLIRVHEPAVASDIGGRMAASRRCTVGSSSMMCLGALTGEQTVVSVDREDAA